MKMISKDFTEILNKEEINGEELQLLISAREKQLVEFILVDVREKEEYEEKRIVGVDYLIPSLNFAEKRELLANAKQKTIIMQFRSGIRSYHTQQTLKDLGYKSVINLKGGILAFPGKVI